MLIKLFQVADIQHFGLKCVSGSVEQSNQIPEDAAVQQARCFTWEQDLSLRLICVKAKECDAARGVNLPQHGMHVRGACTWAAFMRRECALVAWGTTW